MFWELHKHVLLRELRGLQRITQVPSVWGSQPYWIWGNFKVGNFNCLLHFSCAILEWNYYSQVIYTYHYLFLLCPLCFWSSLSPDSQPYFWKNGISPFHAERIAQLLHMCIENHMTGRLDVSLWTLDAHVIYFHSCIRGGLTLDTGSLHHTSHFWMDC